MTAFDEIISKNGSEDLELYRKMLVSQKGSLVSGVMPEQMSLTVRPKKAIVDLLSSETDEANNTTSADQLGALYIKKNGGNGSRDYGFIFDKAGTERIISDLNAGNQLQIFRDYSSCFLFGNQRHIELWDEAKDTIKRRLISQDLRSLRKKTDMTYRMHGSRLHYLTIGKISATIHEQSTAERRTFPLFLFDCIALNEEKQTIDVEQSGFVNFAADEKYFHTMIQKIVGGKTIDIDNSLPTRLNEIKTKLEKLEYPDVEDIVVDITFSMISVVTGFEAEYLDKTWEKILRYDN